MLAVPYILYHKGTMSDAKDAPQAGTQTNQSFIANVNTAKEISGEILEGSVQGNLQTTVQGINHLIDQNNQNGKGLPGLLNAFQKNAPSSGKK